jgi:ATP-dependent Clp protease ATP-binding subunit ClpC
MVVFRPLSRENLLRIVEIMLSDVRHRLEEKGIGIGVESEAQAMILEKGFQPKFGARPLRRAIQSMIEDRLADSVLSGQIGRGTTVTVRVADNENIFDTGELPALDIASPANP